jgi:hypothetical protein
MPRVAIIARIFPLTRGVKVLTAGDGTDEFELETVVPRDSETVLRICLLHRKAVYFDEPNCPCCELIAERWPK